MNVVMRHRWEGKRWPSGCLWRAAVAAGLVATGTVVAVLSVLAAVVLYAGSLR